MSFAAGDLIIGSSSRVPSPPLSPEKDFHFEAEGDGPVKSRLESRIQEQVERLLDVERVRREADHRAVLKRLDAQEATVADVSELLRRRQSGADGGGGPCEGEHHGPDVLELVQRLLGEARAEQGAEWDLALSAEREKWQACFGDTVGDLQRQFKAFQETQTWQTSHTETLFEYMHRDLETLREKVHQKAHADEELKSWSQASRQSQSDMSRRITEVCSSVEGSEQSLRQEMEAVRQDMESSLQLQRAEISEITRNLAEERRRREAEAREAQGRLEGACNQLLDLQAAVNSSTSPSSASSSNPKEVASLRAAVEAVEAVRRELVRLEAAAEEAAAARIEDAAASRTYAEDCIRKEMEKCSERLKSDLARKIRDSMQEERALNSADILELKTRTEDHRMGLEDVQTLRAELALLKSTLQAFVEECQRAATAVVRSEADAEELEAAAKKTAGVVFGSRLEAMEAWCREHAAAVARDQTVAACRIEALEEELRQTAQHAPRPTGSRASAASLTTPASPRLPPPPGTSPRVEDFRLATGRWRPGLTAGPAAAPGRAGSRGALRTTFVAARPAEPSTAAPPTGVLPTDSSQLLPRPGPTQACPVPVESTAALPRSGPMQAREPSPAPVPSQTTEQSGASSPRTAVPVGTSPHSWRNLPRPNNSPFSPRHTVRLAPEGGETSRESQATFIVHPPVPAQALVSPGAVATLQTSITAPGTPIMPPPGVATPAAAGVGTPVASIPPTPVPAWRAGGATAAAGPPPAAHVSTIGRVAVRPAPGSSCSGPAAAPAPTNVVSFWAMPPPPSREVLRPPAGEAPAHA